MPAWSITINIGSNDKGQQRREAYERAARKEAASLNEWVKRVLDAAAKIRFVEEC